MKTVKTKKIISKTFKLLFLIVFISLFACNQNNNKKLSQKFMGKSIYQAEGIKQSGKDLLIGIPNAICYSGFREGQHPDRGDGAFNPSYDEILEDLKILSEDLNFKLMRIYDSGENSEMTLKVIKENNINIKVMLGIWLQAEVSNHDLCQWLSPIPDDILLKNKKLNLNEIEKGINLANKYKDIVVAVNVGNEALGSWTDHKVNTDTIISYVKKIKKAIPQAVTVADNYKWWADNGNELAKVVDFVSIHIYPLWEGKNINEALAYSIENILEVKNAIPKAKIVITEAGWATAAYEFPKRANQDNQLRYYNELMSWTKKMDITTFWFEAFDESWKGDPDKLMGAEKHWGLYTVDRKPKKVIQQ